LSTIDEDFASMRNLVMKMGADPRMLGRVEALHLRVTEMMVERDALMAERPVVLEYEERAREIAKNIQQEFLDRMRSELGNSPMAQHVISSLKTLMVK
jgi:hypothetical protein